MQKCMVSEVLSVVCAYKIQIYNPTSAILQDSKLWKQSLFFSFSLAPNHIWQQKLTYTNLALTVLFIPLCGINIEKKYVTEYGWRYYIKYDMCKIHWVHEFLIMDYRLVFCFSWFTFIIFSYFLFPFHLH